MPFLSENAAAIFSNKMSTLGFRGS